MEPISISLRQIEFLLAVADAGSTAAASRAMNVSQPSISLAIGHCEEVFGRNLFVRVPGRGMELTAFGRTKIAELRELSKQARKALVGGDQSNETIELGVFSTLGPRYGPGLVRAFNDGNPQTTVHIREGDLQSLFDWLSEGRIDLALVYDFGIPSGFSITPLRTMEPYALFPQGHPLTRHETVTAAQIAREPIILMGLPHSRGYFLTVLQNEETPVRIAHETNSVEMVRSMVANGFGVGVLATDIPGNTAYDGAPLTRVPIAGPLPPHQIALARRAGAHTRKAVEAFSQFAIGFFA